EGSRYYFTTEGYYALTGEQNIDGKNYAFDENGACKINTFSSVGEKVYYTDASGQRVKGMNQINGKIYYFDLDTCELYTGWKFVNELYKTSTYYFDGMNGAFTGWRIIDNKTFLFDDNGRMTVGLKIIEGRRYYFDIISGELQSGLVEVSKNNYMYLYTNGYFAKGLFCINNDYYLFNNNGIAVSGWQEIDSIKYYFDPNTKKAFKGFSEIMGKKYYFDPISAKMLCGRQKIEEQWYNFGTDGAMCHGYVQKNSNSFKPGYYYDTDDGHEISGVIELENGYNYYFDDTTHCLVLGQNKIININGINFHLYESGIVTFENQLNKNLRKENDQIYYYDDKGIKCTGIYYIGEKAYYFTDNGIYKATEPKDVFNDGRYYFFDSSRGGLLGAVGGEMRTGLVRIQNKEYYFNEKGVMQTGIIEVNGEDYCFLKGGGIIGSSGIQKDPKSGNSYYFDRYGRVNSGLNSQNSTLFYFDKKNGMLKNQTIKIDGVNYSLDERGYATIEKIGSESDQQSKIIEKGLEWLGRSYDIDTGIYCSSLVSYALSAIDIHTEGMLSWEQCLYFLHDDSIAIVEDINHAKAGDILFFQDANCVEKNCQMEGEIHHSSIYLGNGKVLEASNAEKKVVVHDLFSTDMFSEVLIVRPWK
ncbi:NlpC/P60 family protein, partial [Eubacterium barkeri]